MTDEPRNSRENTRGRPFGPGNPGKPRGARHKVTVAIEALLEGEADKLTRKAVELALAGDVTALRLCMDRLAPPRKDAPIAIELPTVTSMADAVAASTAVLAAVAGGDCTPDEGARVMGLLSAHRSIVEVGDIERRLTALEGKTA